MRNAILAALCSAGVLTAAPASAADTLCDPSFEDCRQPLLDLIRNEQVGIDVAFWFMEDPRYTFELERARQRGVPVRVLVDTRANSPNPLNAPRLAELEAAGIPMRQRTASGILHWKVMLFEGQNTVQFSAANYSEWAFVPVTPYQNYVDEVIYFTTDDSITNSFRTRFDDLWTDTVYYADYANMTAPPVRHYGTFPVDPELNFGPWESFRDRSLQHYAQEQNAIDVIMYRITDRAHTDAIIAATQRGVPVRLLTEPQQYRDPARHWHAWNVDRLYMAGVQIRHRAHQGLLHQKSTLLRSQQMTVFGSSNWTSPSSDRQEEHNYFTVKPNFYQFFSAQFDRKWNNLTGFAESKPFAPLPPDVPVYVAPADLATNMPEDSVTLTFNGGLWAHNYDIYFGTTPDPPLYAASEPLGPSASPTHHLQYTVTGLQPGTTYYWRIVSKTMAEQTAAGPVSSFRTAGSPPPPPPPPTGGPGEVVLWAMRAPVVAGAWTLVADPTAAGNARMQVPDYGVPKMAPSASPADYFELTFYAEAGVPYRLWMRGRADSDHYWNDSAHVQFSGTVTASGTPVWRIGTSDSAIYTLQNGSGAPLAEWGWEDHGWATMGTEVRFASTGTQTIRVSRREDGLSIDQIVLSPQLYFDTAPGANVHDNTILPESNGGPSSPPDPTPTPTPGPTPTPTPTPTPGPTPTPTPTPTPAPTPTPTPTPTPPSGSADEIVLAASRATVVGTDWRLVSDPTAATSAAVENANLGRAKVVAPLASPSDYVELTFHAEAGKAYRLWIRLRAAGDHWANDSIHVQFSGSVDQNGAAAWRIGSTQGAEVNLEDCSGCGVLGWGWQDNGWGVGVMGPLIRFETTGPQSVRIQRREDGVRFDQLVLSAVQYLNSAPGALKNDTTILAR